MKSKDYTGPSKSMIRRTNVQIEDPEEYANWLCKVLPEDVVRRISLKYGSKFAYEEWLRKQYGKE